MAKKSSIEKNERRKKMTAQLRNKRARLKAQVMNREAEPEERFTAALKLAEMPRNSSKIRVRNRCALTGRPRGNFRKFNLCRVALRNLASRGELPGVTKSSW